MKASQVSRVGSFDSAQGFKFGLRAYYSLQLPKPNFCRVPTNSLFEIRTYMKVGYGSIA